MGVSPTAGNRDRLGTRQWLFPEQRSRRNPRFYPQTSFVTPHLGPLVIEGAHEANQVIEPEMMSQSTFHLGHVGLQAPKMKSTVRGLGEFGMVSLQVNPKLIGHHLAWDIVSYCSAEAPVKVPRFCCAHALPRRHLFLARRHIEHPCPSTGDHLGELDVPFHKACPIGLYSDDSALEFPLSTQASRRPSPDQSSVVTIFKTSGVQ